MNALQKMEQEAEQIGKKKGFKNAIIRLLANGMNKVQAAEILRVTMEELEDFLKA